MNYWKPQHRVFIRCMLQHEDATKAYRTAYPKAKAASARVGGIRLMQYPHIRAHVEPVLQLRRAEERQRTFKQWEERVTRQEARRLEMRRYLCRIVSKEIRQQRRFKIKGEWVTACQDFPITVVLSALTLDLRLAGGYDNWPVIERRFQRILQQTTPPQTPQSLPAAIENAGHPGIAVKWMVPLQGTGMIGQQTVTNSTRKYEPAGNSPFEGGHQCTALMGGCVTNAHTRMPHTSPSAPFKGGTRVIPSIRQQPVTNSPANPPQQPTPRHSKTLRITRPTTKITDSKSLMHGSPSDWQLLNHQLQSGDRGNRITRPTTTSQRTGKPEKSVKPEVQSIQQQPVTNSPAKPPRKRTCVIAKPSASPARQQHLN